MPNNSNIIVIDANNSIALVNEVRSKIIPDSDCIIVVFNLSYKTLLKEVNQKFTNYYSSKISLTKKNIYFVFDNSLKANLLKNAIAYCTKKNPSPGFLNGFSLYCGGTFCVYAKSNALPKVETYFKKIKLSKIEKTLLLPCNSVSNGIIQNDSIYKFLLDKSHDLVRIVSADKKIKYISPSVKNILGYEPNELLNTNAFDSVHPDDKIIIEDALVYFKDKPGVSVPIKIRLKTNTGDYRIMEGTLTNFLHEPIINGTLSNLTDVTEKVEAIIKHSNTEANLRTILENTKTAYILLDLNFNIIEANSTAKQMAIMEFGHEPPVGANYINLFREERRVELRKYFNRTLNGEFVSYEVLYDSANYKHWFEVWLEPINNNGNITGICMAIEIITERKAFEHKLKISHAHLIASQRLAHIGSWEVSIKNTIPFDNLVIIPSPECMKIYGLEYSKNKLEFNEYFALIIPEDRDFVYSKYKEAFKSRRGFEIEFRININNTIKTLFQIAKFDTDSYDSDTIFLLGTTTDISKQKQEESEKSGLINDLLEQNKNLEQFSFIVSHNLRSPVSNIIGLVYLLQSNYISEEEKNKCLDGLLTSAEKLNSVIQDLSIVLKMRKERMSAFETVNLNNVLKEVKTEVADMIYKKEALIIADFKVLSEISSIKTYIHSIFYNLILNSLKYCRTNVKPIIEIKTEIKDNILILTFKDNGLGIDLKNQGDKVFGLYKRFHPEFEGKGMGLFMVKNQIELLGGKISIQSKVKEGTTFTIELKLNNYGK